MKKAVSSAKLAFISVDTTTYRNNNHSSPLRSVFGELHNDFTVECAFDIGNHNRLQVRIENHS